MTLIVVGIAGGASAFALLIELVLFLIVNQKMQKLGGGAETNPGPGSSICLLLHFTSYTIWDLLGRSLVSSMSFFQVSG